MRISATSSCYSLLLASAAVVSAFSPSIRPTTRPAADFSSLHLFNSDRNSENEVRRRLEFKNLEPVEETEARRRRIERDMKHREQFEKFGDDLWDLRSEMELLSKEVVEAAHKGSDVAEAYQRLRNAEQRDPELAYMIALTNMETAEKEKDMVKHKEHKVKALAARSCLPQFNLDGLWVGKYGSSYDLINITYVGDTLIAEKVTGEGNVPMGAISFQVDLNPLRRFGKKGSEEQLEPIILTEKAAQRWGTRKLPRYSGLGQVAEENFKNNQWLDGQLIIIGDEYFSFAWLPIEQQIFFGRPSAELALKMLRDNGVTKVPSFFDTPPSLNDDISIQKDFVARCLELTHDHEDELDGGNAFGGIWQYTHNEEDKQECIFG